jgi:hypothetical protein
MNHLLELDLARLQHVDHPGKVFRRESKLPPHRSGRHSEALVAVARRRQQIAFAYTPGKTGGSASLEIRLLHPSETQNNCSGLGINESGVHPISSSSS